MEKQEVIRTLESFAAHESAAVTAEVRNAISAAATLLRDAPARRSSLPSAGTPWSQDEDARLVREFDASMTIAQIALQHGRSSGAITSRLVKLGRIDPMKVQTRDRGARVAS
ncbi:MAG TPA: hypothetical protein VM733_11475 [Thermoanaerobaculia bacterium]|nr:hypothetical protein [Thermoanaerobaculia bacterium]